MIAIDLMKVQEIMGIGEIAHLNKHPELTIYLLELRGHPLAVFDFRRHKIESGPETSIIVLHDKIHDLTFGLITDSLNEIMEIPNELSQQKLSSDSLDLVIQNTDVIKFMVTVDDTSIWLMSPILLSNWQARKIHELYQ